MLNGTTPKIQPRKWGPKCLCELKVPMQCSARSCQDHFSHGLMPMGTDKWLCIKVLSNAMQGRSSKNGAICTVVVMIVMGVNWIEFFLMVCHGSKMSEFTFYSKNTTNGKGVMKLKKTGRHCLLMGPNGNGAPLTTEWLVQKIFMSSCHSNFSI